MVRLGYGTALAAMAFLVACASTAPSEVELGAEFTLAPNQTARVAGTDLTIGFRRVVGDSRCPVDVFCVVEGSAGVELDIFGSNAGDPIVLESQAGQDVWTDGVYSVQLLGLEPAPTTERQIQPDEYRVRLVVTES